MALGVDGLLTFDLVLGNGDDLGILDADMPTPSIMASGSITRPPGVVEPRLEDTVHSQVDEPGPSGNYLHPVLLFRDCSFQIPSLG